MSPSDAKQMIKISAKDFTLAVNELEDAIATNTDTIDKLLTLKRKHEVQSSIQSVYHYM